MWTRDIGSGFRVLRVRHKGLVVDRDCGLCGEEREAVGERKGAESGGRWVTMDWIHWHVALILLGIEGAEL